MMKGRVLITGAACRIGRAIALHLAEKGYAIIVHCNKSRSEAESLLNEMSGVGHSIVQGDLLNDDFRTNLIPTLCAEGRAPSALVNNASVYSRKSLAESTPEIAEESMRINFLAPFELMRQFKNYVGKGCIVNITDQRNAFPDCKSGIYAIAKKALQDATEAAAIEWAPDIRVNAVAPGIVLPPPGKQWEKMLPLIDKIPLKQRTTEQQIADAVHFLIDSTFITGQTIYADGGLHLLGHSMEN